MVITKAVFDIADGQLQQGIDALKENGLFLRRMLRQSSTLISRMVVLAMVRKQARAVSELVEAYPALVERHGEVLADLVRPFDLQEQSFVSVFTNEARWSISIVHDAALRPLVVGEDEIRMGKRLANRIAGWFYQPNATANIFATSWSLVLRDAERAPSEYSGLQKNWADQTRKLIDAHRLPYLHYLSNPVGKTLMEVAAFNGKDYVAYMEKSADANGYLRLVSLQIELRRKKIADNLIQDYANKSEERFRSPYDGKPMSWLPAQRKLEFVGRQDAFSGTDEKNVFAVRLR